MLNNNLDRKDFYPNLKSKLDKSSTETVSVETYKIRISRSNFWLMLVYLYMVSFLTTLDICKAYFKKVVAHAESALVHYSL